MRGSVEETLNELLEAEAEKLTQAARYERNEARQGYRSSHYDRNLTTTSGDITLHVPRLKGVSFETAIIELYRRRESSVEEGLIEMYLAGVSVRRVEDITEALWGSKVSPATISELNNKAYLQITGENLLPGESSKGTRLKFTASAGFTQKAIDKNRGICYNSICRFGHGSGRICRGVAQFGSARALGAWGRRFESCHPDHGVTSWSSG